MFDRSGLRPQTQYDIKSIIFRRIMLRNVVTRVTTMRCVCIASRPSGYQGKMLLKQQHYNASSVLFHASTDKICNNCYRFMWFLSSFHHITSYYNTVKQFEFLNLLSSASRWTTLLLEQSKRYLMVYSRTISAIARGRVYLKAFFFTPMAIKCLVNHALP